MIISNRRIKDEIPTKIKIADVLVDVVNSFKLLGVTIDNRMTFSKFAADTRMAINRKLYSIKRLFYLATSVKIQFFKTFILPYFDYCLSLLIYFPKETIQSLSNCFNTCLFKLFKFKLESVTSDNDDDENKLDSDIRDFNNFNQKLHEFGLFTFQHRLMNKLLTFLHYILNNQSSPEILKTSIARRAVMNEGEITNSRTLRSKVEYNKDIVEKFGRKTFSYFFDKLRKDFAFNDFSLNKRQFNQSILANMCSNFNLFIRNYAIFDISYSTFHSNSKSTKTSNKRKNRWNVQ